MSYGDEKMNYCDDIECPQLNYNIDDEGSNCELGFNNSFRVPKSMADAVY